uniref:uncharacterized protein LOC122601649 n=1 Tax=Erigeron canadensis TaxID=72917 RepID=UPI001CB9C3D9|nr:uncharacterized protein LOC122601649 [Erigeron canadensis]
MSLTDDFEHLRIQLKDIKLATNNFSDKPIGIGGFGKVYKGELSLPNGEKKTVAFKRLDRQYGQGEVEFWKEIMMLSQYKHENLISLVGYSDDDGERILVYEYASGGSLDRYLDKTSLTWTQLLQICHGAARGINHLHDPVDRTQPRVLHRDVKSSNILLDENLTAKISDFGLSKFGPAAHQHYTYLVTGAVGTQGYCDPMYMETGSLSKESDVYSFGVVLFEVMCGRSCYELCSNGEQNILVHKWKECYQENGINDIISNHLKEHTDVNIDRESLDTFASIAYRCLQRNRKERPTMAEVIKELLKALDIQETYGDVDERNTYTELVSIANQATTPQHNVYTRDWEMMIKPAPITGKSRTELALLLSQGIHVLKSEHRIERNKNGEYYELISGYKCQLPGITFLQFFNFNTDVFYGGKGFPCISISSSNQLLACPRFLSLNVTYNMNLFYRYLDDVDKGEHVPLKYKLHEEKEYWTSCVAQRRGKWLISTLYQFNSYQKEHDFKIEVIGRLHPDHVHRKDVHCDSCALFLVGIEFVPVEHTEKDGNLEEDEINFDMKPNLDNNWEEKLPSDYAEIIKLSKDDNMQSKTHKELYYLLRSGFLIHTSIEIWFSVSKSMKKCHMLPAISVLQKRSTPNFFFWMQQFKWKSFPESRFELVAECCKIKEFTIVCELESQLLSPQTTYACYLVYKLPTNPSLVSGLLQTDDKTRGESNRKLQIVDLLTPTHIPFIRRRVNEPHDIPKRTCRIKGHPKLRKDGWLEIHIWDFHTDATNKPIMMHCHVKSYDQCNLTGLLVQGIEFRPAKVVFASSP